MGCSPVNNKNLNWRTYSLEIKDSPIARQSICKRNRKMVVGEENMVLSNNIKIIVEENMDPFAKYSNMTLIKEGRFSSVYTVIHSVTGKKRVMKIFHKKRIKDEFTQDDLANQIEILKNLSHPNIIKLFEVFTYNFKIYMIYEYCPGGNLLDLLEKDATFSEQKCRNIMFQVLSAVSYCHAKGIAHHDLCPEHIVLDNIKALTSKEDYNAYSLKIINFGSYMLFNQSSAKSLSPRKRRAISIGYKSISNPYFAAPETIEGNLEAITEKCDIWSCGVLMYLLLSGELPFKNDITTQSPSHDIPSRVSFEQLKFRPVEIWDNISTESKDLVKSLLQISPQKRPSATDALKSRFFTQSDSFVTKSINKKQFNLLLTNMRQYNYKYKLKDAITSFIIHHLMKKEDVDTMRKAFSVFDKNHDGKISKKELISVMERIMTPIQATKEVNKILANLNKEHNDEIEYEEFIKTAIDMDKIINERNLKMIFDSIDKDSSGSVTKYELKNFFLGAYSTDSLMSDDKVFVDLIKEIDVNGDGEITYNEFKKMMLK